MDKFPEAFERFEEDVDVREIRSFRQLRLAFSFWAGYKWKETPRQIKALRVEARRVGVPVKAPRKPVTVYRAQPRVVRPYRVETITRRGKPATIYRDVETGRFISSPKRRRSFAREQPRREIRR